MPQPSLPTMLRQARQRLSTSTESQSSAASAKPTAAPAEKPRAVGAMSMSKRKTHFWRAAVGGGTLLFAGFLAYRA